MVRDAREREGGDWKGSTRKEVVGVTLTYTAREEGVGRQGGR